MVELTGYHKPSCQIRWLKGYGVRFFVGADGYPRVLESELTKPAKHASEPDFAALRRLR